MADPVEVMAAERVNRLWVKRVGPGRTISDSVMEPLGQRVSGYIARTPDPVGGLLTQMGRRRPELDGLEI